MKSIWMPSPTVIWIIIGFTYLNWWIEQCFKNPKTIPRRLFRASLYALTDWILKIEERHQLPVVSPKKKDWSVLWTLGWIFIALFLSWKLLHNNHDDSIAAGFVLLITFAVFGGLFTLDKYGKLGKGKQLK